MSHPAHCGISRAVVVRWHWLLLLAPEYQGSGAVSRWHEEGALESNKGALPPEASSFRLGIKNALLPEKEYLCTLQDYPSTTCALPRS